MSVSVNISTKDFFYVDIYDVLIELIQRYDISVENLKLEITESAFTVDLGKQLEMIEKLQNAGFVIEMDDFGSGYSSLNSLKDIPVDVLKMDMAFMSKSDRYQRSADILQMVVKMAEKLKMPVIAEGVETKEQADFLREHGCSEMQGYYFFKPMPVESFEKLGKTIECA
jgi:EAL domain-containing protein (putative c-di-GMP-specific phosphodiesterase class I)